MTSPTNAEIASVLERIAELLEAQGANIHRVRAYRSGAESVRTADGSVAEMAASGGERALLELPAIGEGLARLIARYVERGRSELLARLQGKVSPEDLFKQVPGIGETLARRIAEQLDIETLQELEQAARDGRLARVDGFGQDRVQAVRLSLAGLLSGAAQQKASGANGSARGEQPTVPALLEIDKLYRRRAEAGDLKTIAPKRFNPEGEAWLPIMHEEREGWSLTALYSNTARAHELDKTHDWVVLYYERNEHEGQATVVTETHGPLAGKRVVRGRESECEAYYGKRG
jgi:DNA polymerase (family X)